MNPRASIKRSSITAALGGIKSTNTGADAILSSGRLPSFPEYRTAWLLLHRGTCRRDGMLEAGPHSPTAPSGGAAGHPNDSLKCHPEDWLGGGQGGGG